MSLVSIAVANSAALPLSQSASESLHERIQDANTEQGTAKLPSKDSPQDSASTKAWWCWSVLPFCPQDDDEPRGRRRGGRRHRDRDEKMVDDHIEPSQFDSSVVMSTAGVSEAADSSIQPLAVDKPVEANIPRRFEQADQPIQGESQAVVHEQLNEPAAQPQNADTSDETARDAIPNKFNGDIEETPKSDKAWWCWSVLPFCPQDEEKVRGRRRHRDRSRENV